MVQDSALRKAAERLFDEMVKMQHQKLLHCGCRILPQLTADDLLQPNDFPELENHPEFRYEEGILAGLLSALAALRRLHRLEIEENSF